LRPAVRVSERLCELVELDLVRVELSRIDPRMPEQRPQGSYIAVALTQEAIGEAVA
jgi:hypothetical protein